MEFMTVAEASKRYGFPKYRLYEEIREGRLVARKPRGCSRGFRLKDEDVLRWMDEGMELVVPEATR